MVVFSSSFCLLIHMKRTMLSWMNDALLKVHVAKFSYIYFVFNTKYGGQLFSLQLYFSCRWIYCFIEYLGRLKHMCHSRHFRLDIIALFQCGRLRKVFFHKAHNLFNLNFTLNRIELNQHKMYVMWWWWTEVQLKSYLCWNFWLDTKAN